MLRGLIHRGDKHYERRVCRQCLDLRRKRRNHVETCRSILEATIPPLYKRATFARIDKRVRGAMASSPGGFVLFGPPGAGKTFCLCAYARHWIIKNQWRPMRTTWDKLLLEVRRTFKPDAHESELDVLKPYMDAPLLLLEDIGATTGLTTAESDFSLRVLMLVLDHRIEQCLPLCVTTNKTQENLGKSFNPRIASRLGSFRWIGIGGKDKRVSK